MSDKAEDTWRQRRLALVGHDIRSAAGDILGGLQLIDDSALDAESLVQLERVRAAGETLGRLLDEASAALGAPEGASLEGSDAPVALLDLVRDLERRWAGHAAAQGLTLGCDLATSLPPAVAVPAVELERILSNLLDNALKYADRGTITLAALRDDDGTLRFSIRDEGPGFSEVALSRLFGYGARPACSAEAGSGMGLHIAKRLADQIGGRLAAGNLAGARGAEVTLLLPPESWRMAGDASGPGALPDLAGRSVLVAEDNPTNQALLERMLTQLGASCRIVGDGAAASEAIRGGGFHAALV
ncbi:MAG: hypothetical protein GVY27_01755, partial [Deinococcus-Thermus bacterium]|nr:hypothetical protein [Deinococcota bacterium]